MPSCSVIEADARHRAIMRRNCRRSAPRSRPRSTRSVTIPTRTRAARETLIGLPRLRAAASTIWTSALDPGARGRGGDGACRSPPRTLAQGAGRRRSRSRSPRRSRSRRCTKQVEEARRREEEVRQRRTEENRAQEQVIRACSRALTALENARKRKADLEQPPARTERAIRASTRNCAPPSAKTASRP